MGAKTWMLVYANRRVEEALRDSPKLDRDATLQLAETLFPNDRLEPIGSGSLSHTCPPDDEIDIGCFTGVCIVAAKEFGIDYPSKLSQRFISAADGRTIICMQCTAWLIGLHSHNGSKVDSFDPSAFPLTAG